MNRIMILYGLFGCFVIIKFVSVKKQVFYEVKKYLDFTNLYYIGT